MTSSIQKPLVIPVFLPNAGCPHQCVFCNQASITGGARRLPTSNELRSHLRRYLAYGARRRGRVQVSFYGGNFLGLNADGVSFLLGEIGPFVSTGHVDGIRFSTRPDTVTEDRLALLRGHRVSTIELGVQSMDDGVLAGSERGHRASDTLRAVPLLKERDYEVGLQMMMGLPGDSEAGALESARRIADLAPDFVRIYPTVVLRNSRLAQWYEQGAYTPMDLRSAVTLAKKLLLLFSARGIRVIRMGIQVTEDTDSEPAILAGPYHPAFGHLVYSEIMLDRITGALASASLLQDSHPRICIRTHPRNVARVRGLRNHNIHALKRKHRIESVQVIPDASLGEDDVTINGLPCPV